MLRKVTNMVGLVFLKKETMRTVLKAQTKMPVTKSGLYRDCSVARDTEPGPELSSRPPSLPFTTQVPPRDNPSVPGAVSCANTPNLGTVSTCALRPQQGFHPQQPSLAPASSSPGPTQKPDQPAPPKPESSHFLTNY